MRTAAGAIAIGTAGLASFAGWGSTSYAFDNAYFDRRATPPAGALEIVADVGYAQGLGDVAPGTAISNVCGAGLVAGAGVGARFRQRWSLDVEAQYQVFVHGSDGDTGARGFQTDIGATYHRAPNFRGDPWLRLGTGYRLLWEDERRGATGATVLRHGFDLVALKLGFDMRLLGEMAIAPVLGADMNVFLWEDSSKSGSRALPSATVGSFVYLGIQGRFDL